MLQYKSKLSKRGLNLFCHCILIIHTFILLGGVEMNAQSFHKSEVKEAMVKVNDYWIQENPDYGDNRWYRAVYYTGNMAMYNLFLDQKYLDYATAWAQQNNWTLNGRVLTTFADNHAAGQTYIDLYSIKKEAIRIKDITTSMDNMVTSTVVDNWHWIDALYMAMPTFSKLGVLYKDNKYFNKMYDLYSDTKSRRGLYNEQVGLWYRDEKFLPPYKTKGGKDSFWSRGNGWVFGALVKVLNDLPSNNVNRNEYIEDYKKMAQTLAALQRSDGFWNTSLWDSTEFGGPETSGTSFFVYGLAWGINNNILQESEYRPIVEKGWIALVTTAIHPSGKLGYVQQRADRPSASSYDNTADYGVGAFLLAGTEVYKMSVSENPIPGMIEAESFSNKSDEIKIQTNGSTEIIGFIKNNSFTEYNINVSKSDHYEFIVSAAADTGSGGKIVFSIDNELIGELLIPSTTNWNIYRDFKTTLVLNYTGPKVLRLDFVTTNSYAFNLDKIEVKPSSSTDIKNVDEFKSLTVFPNPSNTGEFSLSQALNWEVYTIKGTLITRGGTEQIDLSSYPNGIYLLKANHEVIKLIYK